jgi:hypothetical protein
MKILLLSAIISINLNAETFKISIDKSSYDNSINIIETIIESPEEPISQTYSSCSDILNDSKSIGNGIYSVNNGTKNYNVYCDMTTDGGGCTLIVAQYEDSPVLDWNEGIQNSYDPTLNSNTGFALNTEELPSHSQLAFSIDLNTLEGYINYNYHTGNLSLNDVLYYNFLNQSTNTYQIHRSTEEFYAFHDPENPNLYNFTDNYWVNPSVENYDTYDWADTFTLNKKGTIQYGLNTEHGFTFAPQNQDAGSRGFAHFEELIYLELNSNPWLFWVR